MNKRLAIVFPNLGLGGVQRRMVDISNYIASSDSHSGVTTALIVKELGSFNFKNQLVKSKRINIHVSSDHFSMPKINNIFFLLFVHYQLFFKIRPKTVLVFFHFSLPTVFLYKLFFPKTRIVLSQDNILSLYNKKPHVNIKVFYSLVSEIIVQTHTARRDLINNYSIPEDKIQVIPNWGPLNKPKITPISGRTYDIVYAGRLALQKRLEFFIDFCSQISHYNPNLKVLLLGDGSEKKALERLIRINKLQSVIQIKNPSLKQEKDISQSKFIMLTSEFEGHPMILTEAMTMGVIPIVLDYLGCRDYLHNNIDSIVDSSIEKLVDRYLKFSNDHEKMVRLSRNTTKSALKKFNHEMLMRETLDVIFA
jgi:glycosyltransferase involved in cell wall biosynthesis